MAADSHFGYPKITLYRISYHFRSIPQFLFCELFYKMAASAHFGCPKFTFDRISGHFRSIRNYNFVTKMAAGGHFGCPKITFGRISGHFRSIQNLFLNFFTKCLPSAILDVRNSLWITFLAILDQYRFFIFCWNFLQNGCRWPFGMSENHFRSHFWPFQIDTQLYRSAILDVWNSLSIAILAISDRCRFFFRRPFWMFENHAWLHLIHTFLGNIMTPIFTCTIWIWPRPLRSQITRSLWFLASIGKTKWPLVAILYKNAQKACGSLTVS